MVTALIKVPHNYVSWITSTQLGELSCHYINPSADVWIAFMSGQDMADRLARRAQLEAEAEAREMRKRSKVSSLSHGQILSLQQVALIGSLRNVR